MQHYRSLDEITLPACWLTVGVFDGVHRGHQQILQKLTTGAHAQHVPAVVITFDPHPAKVFGRGDIKLLTLPGERAKLLSDYGVDVIITQPFDREMADVTALDFMKRLKTRLGLSHMILGYDSALGKNREGNIPRLTEIGLELGYAVETVSALSDESDALSGEAVSKRGVISSTEVRKLVSVGNVNEARRLLGHPYRLQGLVGRGDQRGRTIGFPTANLNYAREKVVPAGGIYACWAQVHDGAYNDKYMAAVNIGTNPTFTPDKQTLSIEAYLLDYHRGDIYDQTLVLEFVQRLRDELKYDSVEALIKQINKDVAETREILGTV